MRKNTIVTFGISQIMGSLLGGVLADAVGLRSAFGVYGAFLVVALIAFIVPAKKANMTWEDAKPMKQFLQEQ